MIHTRAAEGSTFLIGRPAKPMSAERSAAIAALVEQVGGIREAHLPQCFNPSIMSKANQILVVVFDNSTDAQSHLQALSEGLSAIFENEKPPDILSLTDPSDLLLSVREAGMQIARHTPP
jgi:hypothetical protein